MILNRDFKISRRRRQRERHKSNWSYRQNNNSARDHAFLSISLPSLHDYDGKMPNFTFNGGRKQETALFFLSLSELEYSS